MSEGFLLGLSTGVVCVAFCGPVLIPYLMAEGSGLKKSSIFVALFLSGRLIAYLLTGLIAGIIGTAIIQQSEIRTTIMGIAYMLLAALLIAYGFYRFREICLGTKITADKARPTNRFQSFLLPVTGGFLTGVNICPPFLLAIAGAVGSGTIKGSLVFFISFFLGTTVFFIPMPFAGAFKRQNVLRIIGRFAAIIAGFSYFYKGLVLLLT